MAIAKRRSRQTVVVAKLEVTILFLVIIVIWKPLLMTVIFISIIK